MRPLLKTVLNALMTSKYDTKMLLLLSKATDSVSCKVIAVWVEDWPFQQAHLIRIIPPFFYEFQKYNLKYLIKIG